MFNTFVKVTLQPKRSLYYFQSAPAAISKSSVFLDVCYGEVICDK